MKLPVKVGILTLFVVLVLLGCSKCLTKPEPPPSAPADTTSCPHDDGDDD